MKKIHRSIVYRGLLLFGLTFIISITGCSSSQSLIERYPHYMDRKSHISSIALSTDVLVVFDGMEEGVVIDIPLSRIIGDSILSIFGHELAKKNYRIGEIYPAAVGYSLVAGENHRDERSYKVFETGEDYSRSADSLKLMSPPFVLENKFLEVEDLLNGAEEQAGAVSPKDSSKYVEQDRDGEYLLYVYLEAHNVSLSKRISEGLLTTIITLGAVTGGPVAQATVYYWMYDIQSGNVVLSDGRVLKGPDLTGDNVGDLLNKMIKEIPAKGL